MEAIFVFGLAVTVMTVGGLIVASLVEFLCIVFSDEF